MQGLALPGQKASAEAHRRELVIQLHQAVLDSGDCPAVGDFEALAGLVSNAAPLCSPAELAEMAAMLDQRLFGLGPIEPLLADAGISDIMINGAGPVWVERFGRVTRSQVVVDADALRMLIERIIGPLGLRVDRSCPLVDARLPDGARVHIAVPPMAIDGPYVTIRRFSPATFTIGDFTDSETAAVLGAAVRDRRNIVVSGGTGSGKTSLLNALTAAIGTGERVVTIEDTAELRLATDHVVRLEARPPNAEGVGQVTIRELVRNALRMRPDRIVVGEVRGGEAFDMIGAMNTGHSGSLTTCHANSAADAIDRIETMVLMSDVVLSAEVARRQIRSAIDLVVHVERGANGQREVASVWSPESGRQ